MKRIIITVLWLVVITCHINAQLLVDANGNVGIKPSGTPLKSHFSINGQGVQGVCSYITSLQDSLDVGLQVYKAGAAQTSHDYTTAINGKVKANLNSTKKIYGFYTHLYKDGGVDTSCGRTYGLYAIAGNATSGWNYGVLGTLFGENNGAGIYGSSFVFDGGMDTQHRYAGFFHGDVKSTDAIYAASFSVISDYRLKENIESVDSECTDDLMKLNVVKYNIKQRSVDMGDTAVTQMDYYSNESGILQHKHYGLIAQELQDIYPDLVYEGGDGYLSVNYMELIPLLIQSIQSLKEEVDQLKESQKSSKRTTIKASNQMEMGLSSISKISVSVEVATISCNISNSVKNANIFIYDTNGNQLYRCDIKDRGRMEIEIRDFAFSDGIYVCSLLTDDNMDSRRFYFGK